MKNTNKLFWSFLGLTVILTSCQEQPKKENPAAIAAEAEQVIYEAPKQIISLEGADSLYINYKDRRATNIVEMEAKYQEDKKPFVPTQFVTFDIEVLQNYLNYVQQEAKTGGVQADSLRIYLGNYGITKNYKNRHNTVFLVPTAKTDDGYGGIYLDDGNAKLIRDYWKSSSEENDKEKSKASFLPNFNTRMMDNHESLILNFGSCCTNLNGDF
ncbi:hypothetical protein [Croceitalea vernalis]|uniref:Lipoprotein n=1 Tax=Croceitalea vernalis TaxID=3075599 RepID=A0ABU3BJC8_9FLAO|nr:hypothetical protein [Croceitalea sp. P007]MDT0622258.1 hypothetical protein [Croceitalea sp. P007]